MAGTAFGRYRLLDQLDTDVWQALDVETGQAVVVAMQPENLSADDELVDYFYREARAAADVRNSHLLPILDVGEIDDRLYVTTPFVGGRTLRNILADGPLTASLAVSVIEQVASALTAAHHRGLVHGKVSAANIVVAQNDFAYLTNLGIAPDLDAEVADDIHALASVLSDCLDEADVLHDVVANADTYPSVTHLARDARAAVPLTHTPAEPPARPGTVTVAAILAFLQAAFFGFLFAGHLLVIAYVRDTWIDLTGLADTATTTGFTVMLGIATAGVAGLLIWGGLAALTARRDKLLMYSEQAAAAVAALGYSALVPVCMTVTMVAALVVIVLLAVPPSRRYFGDPFEFDSQSVFALIVVVLLIAFGWALALLV